jgi:hypothetical protein
MSAKHDQLIKAADELVQAGRRLKVAQEALRMAEAEYGEANAHYKSIERDSPVRPVITPDLPSMDCRAAVRDLLDELLEP